MSGTGGLVSDFKRAKEDSFLIFSDLSELVHGNAEFLETCPAELRDEIADNAVEKSRQFVEQVDNMRTILNRDELKIVFFGRTSSGKSTLINALLGEEVLPSGIGHTTNCFIRVRVFYQLEPEMII